MTSTISCLSPGVYQYTYPTFVDRPQFICIHFLTPDGQLAFVSYPHHPRQKAAQLIPVSWFKSVIMVALEEQPKLMAFIHFLMQDLGSNRTLRYTAPLLPRKKNRYIFSQQRLRA